MNDNEETKGGRAGRVSGQLQVPEEFQHSIILRPKKPLGSWNLVNPLLRLNEAWMDECAGRIQPLVILFKHKLHQTFALRKFQDLIITTRSCPGEIFFFF